MNKNKRLGPPHICEFCGTKFIQWSRSQKQRYCSRKCMGRARTLSTEITCAQCGKNFIPKGTSGRKYCSTKCYDLARAVKPATCKGCGKNFPPRVTANSSYCSLGCYRDHVKKNWKITNWVKKHAFWSIASPNKSEKLLMSIMPKGVSFVGDGKIFVTFSDGSHANPDFVVDGTRKVIELYGGMGFFHSELEAQNRIELYKQIGYQCLVIYESELKKKNAQILKDKILSFMNS